MTFRAAHLLAIIGALALGATVVAQIEGDNRGVPPLDSSGSLEVGGIKVDVRAKSADAARLGGWRIAQREGWKQLWSKTHGGSTNAPALGDSALDAIVAGIVVENEQVGPNRYVATLGVLFDRARAGQILGVSGVVARSAPLLVVPVEISGGSYYVFEQRTEWQKAWARFRTAGSPIDYVRVSGTGSDPLLLNYGQTQRPGRNWWRMILDQYGAADVLVAQVRIERSYPGGPATAVFSARFGPDTRLIANFALRVPSSDGIPAMLDEGVRRMDRIYSDALAAGMLRPDPSLIAVPEVPEAVLDNATEAVVDETLDNGTAGAPDGASAASSFTVQFDTPDVGSVSGIEAGVRGVPGVQSATTTSLALGGVSVMSVRFQGDIAALRTALQARGFRVSEGGGVLRIAR